MATLSLKGKRQRWTSKFLEQPVILLLSPSFLSNFSKMVAFFNKSIDVVQRLLLLMTGFPSLPPLLYSSAIGKVLAVVWFGGVVMVRVEERALLERLVMEVISESVGVK